jgi:hypothetical protein
MWYRLYEYRDVIVTFPADAGITETWIDTTGLTPEWVAAEFRRQAHSRGEWEFAIAFCHAVARVVSSGGNPSE